MNKVLVSTALIACFGIAASATAADKKGDAVYASACAGCHANGVAGSPKFGDVGAWKARIANGLPALTKSVMSGKGAMPPKGGHAELTDKEVANAVIHMANAAGGKFK